MVPEDQKNMTMILIEIGPKHASCERKTNKNIVTVLFSNYMTWLNTLCCLRRQNHRYYWQFKVFLSPIFHVFYLNILFFRFLNDRMPSI